jgi:hypothetical protein
MQHIAPALGVLAGLAGLVGTAPYVRDVIARSTRPQRGTWLIWSLLAIVVCLSQCAEGATWSVVMAGSHAAGNGLVLALALRLGTGGLSRHELTLVALAGAGVTGWMLADDPLAATVCVVVADLIALAMMVPKTWRDPGSETLSTFALASAGGALGAASVGALEPSLLLYPAYYCVANGALALLILGRRAVTRHPAVVPRRPARAAGTPS